MIIFLLIIVIILCGTIVYAYGYKNGVIDGRLEEKWRNKSEK